MEINKIKIDGQEFGVGGGSKLYKHLIMILFSDVSQGAPKQCRIYYEFISNTDTLITKQQFLDYINNYEYPSYNGTSFTGVSYGNCIYGQILNANYGTYNFTASSASVYSDGVKYIDLNLGTNIAEREGLMVDFADTVTPFITEVE